MKKNFNDLLLSSLDKNQYTFICNENANPEITSLVFDSRKATENTLYFAWSGVHVHGNSFIPKAIENGCKAIIYEEDENHLVPEETKNLAKAKGVALVKVDNARFVMSGLASKFYDEPSKKLTCIGVTGTEGKSTTVYLIWQLLRSMGKKAGFISTVDFSLGEEAIPNPEHQTTPESTIVQEKLYQMVQNGCEFAVVESSSHGLSEKTNRLGDVDFDVGVMMNVTSEHLEFHGTYEQYRDDKANLFKKLNCFGVVNGDDKAAALFESKTSKPVYSFNKTKETISDIFEQNFVMEDIKSDSKGEDFTLSVYENQKETEKTENLRIDLPGTFNVYNATAAAIVVSKLLNVSIKDLEQALKALTPVKGRMTVVDEGQDFEVIVDYAHTPSSFETIFPPLQKRLAETTKGKLFVLFGSGGERDTKKRPEQGRIAEKYCDYVFLTDEDPRGEVPMDILEDIAKGCVNSKRDENLFLIPDRPTAIFKAFSMAKKGDIVLLLGKAHENSIIYKDYLMPYDEISEAKKQLNKIKNS